MHEITFSTVDKPKLLSQVVNSVYSFNFSNFLKYFLEIVPLNYWVKLHIILILVSFPLYSSASNMIIGDSSCFSGKLIWLESFLQCYARKKFWLVIAFCINCRCISCYLLWILSNMGIVKLLVESCIRMISLKSVASCNFTQVFNFHTD